MSRPFWPQKLHNKETKLAARLVVKGRLEGSLSNRTEEFSRVPASSGTLSHTFSACVFQVCGCEQAFLASKAPSFPMDPVVSTPCAASLNKTFHIVSGMPLLKKRSQVRRTSGKFSMAVRMRCCDSCGISVMKVLAPTSSNYMSMTFTETQRPLLLTSSADSVRPMRNVAPPGRNDANVSSFFLFSTLVGRPSLESTLSRRCLRVDGELGQIGSCFFNIPIPIHATLIKSGGSSLLA